MTKPLPQPDVTVNSSRQGPPRLTAPDRQALASIKDENLRRVLGEILQQSQANQENFDALAQSFPIQPKDVAKSILQKATYEGGGVRGLPFQKVISGLVSTEGTTAIWERGGSGATAIRKGVGLYWIEYDFKAEGIFAFAQSLGKSVEWSVVTEPEAGVERIVVETFLTKTAERSDAEFFFTAFKVGEEGNTIQGSEGKEGKTQPGPKYTYSTNTESSDPGAGKLKFNKATLSEATLLRISETDGNGNALAPWIATWDDSSSTVRGVLTLTKITEPWKFAIYQVTGLLNDNGTWDSYTVTYVASNGLANNDEVALNFYRTGDQGEQGEKGERGEKGEKGEAGAGGAAGDFIWKWKALLAEVGAGNIAVEGATLEISRTTSAFVLVVEAVLKEWRTGRLLLRNITTGGYRLYRITGAPNVALNPMHFPIELLESSGTAFAVGNEIEVRHEPIIDFGLVTELPTEAKKGDRCQFLASEAEHIIWDLLYDGTKWAKVGGPPLTAYTANVNEETTSGVYVSLASPIKVTTPLAGQYDIKIEGGIWNGEHANTTGFLSYAVGATAASDTWACYISKLLSGASETVNKLHRHTGVAKGAEIIEKVREEGGKCLYSYRRLTVDPVYVE